MDDGDQTTGFEFGVVADRADESTHEPGLKEELISETTTRESQSERRAVKRLAAEPMSQFTTLEQLGIALYYYNTTELSTLVERAERDPDRPPVVVAILPWVRQLVAEDYQTTNTPTQSNQI